MGAGASVEAAPVIPPFIFGYPGLDAVSVRAGWYPRESGVCLTWDAESALFFPKMFSSASLVFGNAVTGCKYFRVL